MYWLRPAEEPLLYTILGVGVGILAFAHVLSPLLSIRPWALGDAGGHLVLPNLLASNLTPNIDFAYTYGPGTIALNYIWALVFGNHWSSYYVLFALLQVALAVSLALVPYVLRLPRIASIAFVLAILHFMRFEYSFAHLAEKIFLINAAILIASGRYGVALALCATSVLFRPSSGLIAGAIILIGLTWQCMRTESLAGATKAIAKVSVPAACVVMVAFCGYATWIGTKSFFLTVLPISGSKLYGPPSVSAALLDVLPRFLPDGQNIFGYLGANPSHAILLAIGGLFLFSLAYMAASKTNDRINAVGFLTLTLTGTFLTTFSGGTFYLYYLPALWVGLIAMAILPRIVPGIRWLSGVVLGMTLASLLISAAYKSPSIARELATLVRHGFNAPIVSDQLRDDVNEIRRKVPSGTVSALLVMGDVALLPAIGLASERPLYWCFRNQGFNLESELQRVRLQIQHNPWIVLRTDQIELFPLGHLVERVHTGRHLTLLFAR
jgi:hypothetical protein